jgi:hypothetical protein
MVAASTLGSAHLKHCPHDHQTASDVFCECRPDVVAVTDDITNIPLSKRCEVCFQNEQILLPPAILCARSGRTGQTRILQAQFRIPNMGEVTCYRCFLPSVQANLIRR